MIISLSFFLFILDNFHPVLTWVSTATNNSQESVESFTLLAIKNSV